MSGQFYHFSFRRHFLRIGIQCPCAVGIYPADLPRRILFRFFRVFSRLFRPLCCIRFPSTAELHLDPHQKFLQIKRLAEIILGSRRQHFHFTVQSAFRGEHNDRRFLCKQGNQFFPRNPRKHQIQYDQIIFFHCKQQLPFTAGICLRAQITMILQIIPEHLIIFGIVFYN